MTTLTLDRHIETTPGIAGGRPRIAGHRITVRDIVVLHLHLGKSVDEICAEYALGLADVHAALAYYFDHRADIDQDIKAGEAFVATLKASRTSVLEQRLKDLQG
jgi:uncharacterized protein (DUF433 family)